MGDDVTRSGNVYYINGATPSPSSKDTDPQAKANAAEPQPTVYIDHDDVRLDWLLGPRSSHPFFTADAGDTPDVLPFKREKPVSKGVAAPPADPQVVPVATPDFEILEKFWGADRDVTQDDISHRRSQAFDGEVRKLRAWITNTNALVRDHLRLVIEHDLLNAPTVEVAERLEEAPRHTRRFTSPYTDELLRRLDTLTSVLRKDIPKLKLHAAKLASSIIPVLHRHQGPAIREHAATVYDSARAFLDKTCGSKVRGHAVLAMADVIPSLEAERRAAARAEVAGVLKDVLNDTSAPQGLRMMLLNKHGRLLAEPLLMDLRMSGSESPSPRKILFFRTTGGAPRTPPAPPSMKARNYLNIVQLGSKYDHPGAPHRNMRLHPDHFDWLVEQVQSRDPLAGVLGTIVLGYIAGEKLAPDDPLIPTAAEILHAAIESVSNPDLSNIEGSSADIFALDNMPPYASDHSGRSVEVALGTVHEGLRGLRRTLKRTGELKDETVARSYTTMTKALIPHAERMYRRLAQRAEFECGITRDNPVQPLNQTPTMGIFRSLMTSLSTFFSGRFSRS